MILGGAKNTLGPSLPPPELLGFVRPSCLRNLLEWSDVHSAATEPPSWAESISRIEKPVGHLGQGSGWFRSLTRAQAVLLRWASLPPPARLCSLCCDVAPVRLEEGQYVSSQAHL